MTGTTEAVSEWCFVVRCAGGEGEIRVRSDGKVLHTAGSSEWISLDGLRWPTANATIVRVIRNDVFRIDDVHSLEGTALASKSFISHYTKADTALRHIIPNQTLRLSTYAGTNDPRESKDWLFTLVSPEGLAPPGESIHVSRRLNSELKHHSSLACFCAEGPASNSNATSTPAIYDTDGWTHARMWAQYADNHRGVVLVFDRKQLIENARDSLRGKGPLFFGNVLYVPQRHTADMYPFVVDYLQWLSLSTRDFAEQHLKEHREWLFFTKHSDWAQENECRLVLYGASDVHEYVSTKGALIEVCVGAAVSDAEVAELSREASKIGCPISRVFWRNGVPYRTPT